MLDLCKLMAQKQINSQIRVLLDNFEISVRYVSDFHLKLLNRLTVAAQYTIDMLNGNEFDAGNVQENIAEVFVNMKPKFVIYAHFIVQCHNFEKHIALMKNDTSTKPELREIEHMLRKELNPTGDKSHPLDLSQLLMLPFQHICRY